MSDKFGLIYDWNSGTNDAAGHRRPRLADETLRDGLQSPSVRNPSIEEKLEILRLMESLAIDSADIGLPGAGAKAAADAQRLAVEIAGAKMRLRPYCAARTVEADIRPIAAISQKAGIRIEVAAFIGTSPIRQYIEEWNLEEILARSLAAVRFAVRENLPVMFVTEDTTRSRPEVVRRLYTEAIASGAESIVVCDTAGHATPEGASRIIRFVRKEVIQAAGARVRLDWHGHSDRGLGVINSIAAFHAGADQIHGSALGIGERVGNTPIDQLLVNMKLMGHLNQDLSRLMDYCTAVSRATGFQIPSNYPVVGSDAFRTGTGVHAAAVIKALKKQDIELANLVYSGVPSHWFGLRQKIEVGPVSGRSNVLFWLEQHGIRADETLVSRIFARAKAADRILTDDEIMAEVAAVDSTGS